MFPILLQYHDLVIFSYPFLMGGAWAISFHMARFYLERARKYDQYFFIQFIGIFISSWFGAKILFLINSANGEFANFATNMNFWLGGGFVFYGGFVASIIFLILYSTFNPKFKFIDAYLFIPPAALAHSIGRIGCFLAGCCYGEKTTFPISIHLNNANRHPVQLYESVLLFIIFLITHYQIIKKMRPNAVIATYTLGYSFVRFILEFIRGDKIRGVYALGISSSQIISVVIGIISISYLIYQNRKRELN